MQEKTGSARGWPPTNSFTSSSKASTTAPSTTSRTDNSRKEHNWRHNSVWLLPRNFKETLHKLVQRWRQNSQTRGFYLFVTTCPIKAPIWTKDDTKKIHSKRCVTSLIKQQRIDKLCFFITSWKVIKSTFLWRHFANHLVARNNGLLVLHAASTCQKGDEFGKIKSMTKSWYGK